MSRFKFKTHIIISKDVQNASNKIQQLFAIKNTGQIRNKSVLLNLMKSINENPTVDITLNGERLNTLSPALASKIGEQSKIICSHWFCLVLFCRS